MPRLSLTDEQSDDNPADNPIDNHETVDSPRLFRFRKTTVKWGVAGAFLFFPFFFLLLFCQEESFMPGSWMAHLVLQGVLAPLAFLCYLFGCDFDFSIAPHYTSEVHSNPLLIAYLAGIGLSGGALAEKLARKGGMFGSAPRSAGRARHGQVRLFDEYSLAAGVTGAYVLFAAYLATLVFHWFLPSGSPLSELLFKVESWFVRPVFWAMDWLGMSSHNDGDVILIFPAYALSVFVAVPYGFLLGVGARYLAGLWNRW